MLLKIQEYILTHPNWRIELAEAPYCLKISEDDGFVLFKYNQISSDFNQEICREARGLILDSQDNFKVVRLAFYKFFNIDEPFAAHIDWSSAVASEKIDGSIMSVWYARGKWHLSTNGTIDAFKAEIAGVGPYKTFGDLFESVCPLATFEHFDKNKCFTFELVSPYNKVVIDYPETKVYLLSIRDMTTLIEYSLDDLHTWAEANGFITPQVYKFCNETGYRKIVESMGQGHEGIVVSDTYGNRVKIKTLLYFEMHRARNNGVMTLERAVELILANDHAEFLSYFPEYTNYFNAVAAVINGVHTIAFTWDNSNFQAKWEEKFSSRVAKKQFALEFATKCAGGLQALAFKCYEGRGAQWLTTLTPAQWTHMFAHQFAMVKEVVQ